MLFEKFDELKQILGCQNLTDAELLISIGKATKDNKFVESLQLEEKIVREIFVEVLDKLSWLGESYVELI